MNQVALSHVTVFEVDFVKMKHDLVAHLTNLSSFGF